MVAGHDQGVTGEEGPVVEEGDRVGLVEDDVGGDGTGDDATEGAGGVGRAHPVSGDVYGRRRGGAAARVGTITLRRK